MSDSASGPQDRSTVTDVWMDTDTAIGVPGADVDDGLALIQAFHSPELCVRGVSSVFGNAPLDKTHPIACEVVRRFGPAGLSVQAGAASAQELGRENAAVRAIAAALRERPLSLLALGPVTNVASVVRLHPDLAPRIRCIAMVAARRPGQHFLSNKSQKTPFPDMNFESDPDAMQVLLSSRIELVFAPWEVSSHVWITRADLEDLETRSESAAYIARESRAWLEVWEREMGAPGFNPFDTLAIAWLTHPELIDHFRAGVWIDEAVDDMASSEDQRAGKTKPHLFADAARLETDRNATYCFEPRPDFKPLLMARLAARPEGAR